PRFGAGDACEPRLLTEPHDWWWADSGAGPAHHLPHPARAHEQAARAVPATKKELDAAAAQEAEAEQENDPYVTVPLAG
ncbi:hypothetical protein KBZ21_43985, partial [Streptomyces sp. A73]|nr:hypothetical protein [Streptomyces sp. A73]